MTTPTTITLRPSGKRGTTNIAWLQSRHSFSFGQYRDPANTHYSELRVINDDWIASGQGFGKHPHRDMEILTWVLQGKLRHGDSLGNMRDLGPGELQAMSAGTGIEHSEVNASPTDSVHLLQIWIEPANRDIAPRYDQRTFDPVNRQGRWDTLAAGPAQLEIAPAAMPIHQDAAMHVVDLTAGQSVPVVLAAGRKGYVHLATGSALIDDQQLVAGDAVTFEGQASLTLTTTDQAQVLFFDLP